MMFVASIFKLGFCFLLLERGVEKNSKIFSYPMISSRIRESQGFLKYAQSEVARPFLFSSATSIFRGGVPELVVTLLDRGRIVLSRSLLPKLVNM